MSSLDVADFCATADPFEGDWIDVAAELFCRHGFCILLNALGDKEVFDVLETCLEVEAEMLQLDPDRLGCRGAGRYSFGAASKSGHMLHHPAWLHLLQSRPVLTVLKRVLPEGFVFCGGGGDFVLGRTANYQSLHSDLGPSKVPPECRSNVVPPMISVNFTVQDITGENGPLRVVPGRRLVGLGSDAPPPFSEEPEVLRQSKLFPLPAGAAIIRDLRLWHGGTPNTSDHTRFLPSVELMSLKYSQFISAPHSLNYTYCQVCKWHQCSFYCTDSPCLPDALFETLRPEVQKLCEQIRGEVPLGMRPFARAQRSWEKESWSRWKWHWRSSGETMTNPGKRLDSSLDSSLDSFGTSACSATSGRKSSWHEAKPGNGRSAWSQKNLTPDRSWEGESGTQTFAVLKDGFAAAGTMLTKTLRISLGVILIAKGIYFLNLISTRFERGGSKAKLRLVKALSALPMLQVNGEGNGGGQRKYFPWILSDRLGKRFANLSFANLLRMWTADAALMFARLDALGLVENQARNLRKEVELFDGKAFSAARLEENPILTAAHLRRGSPPEVFLSELASGFSGGGGGGGGGGGSGFDVKVMPEDLERVQALARRCSKVSTCVSSYECELHRRQYNQNKSVAQARDGISLSMDWQGLRVLHCKNRPCDA
eukprot:Skav230746  [mRNA]  locus=scaffold3436:88554:92609:+ [translate_table: standard]